MTTAPDPTPGPSIPEPEYVRVAIPVPVGHGFTYRVPLHLRGRVGRGDRVEVRFRGRKTHGTVLGSDRGEGLEPARILPLQALLDPEARLPEELVDLCLWVAEEFGASVGESLDAALPPSVRRGGRPRQVVSYSLVLAPEEVADRVAELASKFPEQSRALRILADSGGELSERELRSAAKISHSPLQTLARKGWLKRTSQEAYTDPLFSAPVPPEVQFELNTEQRNAVKRIAVSQHAGRFEAFLLQGVTGSGKTEVYLQALAAAVSAGRSGIALVPEIALTPQTVARFRARFPRIAVLHSLLTEAERMRQWLRIRRGEVDVVVGARSAVFAPLSNLGLIVVDEEHEPSFKQQNPPRYHARDVAVARARRVGAIVVLGSATPSLESDHAADRGSLTRLILSQRVGSATLPAIEVVDLGSLPFRREPRLLSDRLRQRMRETLRAGEQTILFLNRRGFARMGLCTACRQPLTCSQCDVSLVYHEQARRWICHLCAYETTTPAQCPECKAPSFRMVGFGTQRVEAELRRDFPEARIARMDSDSTLRRGSHEEILDAFGKGEVDVLLGTQMVAKGLDFPRVTLVGIVSADTSLSIPDFRSSERTFQLVSQVAGRAGRADRPGKVIVQTLQPDHAAIQAAVDHDFAAFRKGELAMRKALGYPPYGRVLRVLVSHAEEERTRAAAVRCRERLEEPAALAGAKLLGPAPCPITRVRGWVRYQLLVKVPEAGDVRSLVQCARETLVAHKPVRITLDVDPVALL